MSNFAYRVAFLTTTADATTKRSKRTPSTLPLVVGGTSDRSLKSTSLVFIDEQKERITVSGTTATTASMN
jgi:hypothetical protein